MFVPPARVRSSRLRRAAARAQEQQWSNLWPLVSPYQLMSTASYRAGQSADVASPGVLRFRAMYQITVVTMAGI